jgi:toxin HigB-1
MIRTFKHKGLRELFERGASRRVNQNHVERCQQILAVINAAQNIQQINLPGYVLHDLKPSRPSVWSVRVQGPWRITFEFRNGDAYAVDLEQYH